MISFIFLNLFIVIIFESFNASKAMDRLKVSQSTLEDFSKLWGRFDPAGSGYMSIDCLPELLVFIIEREIRLYDEAKQEFEDGKINKEEFNGTIFMFNLYKHLMLVQIAKYKRIKEDCELCARNKEKIDKMLAKFIANLKVPLYDKFKLVYYYDILEALTRSLFQQLISDAKYALKRLEKLQGGESLQKFVS